MRFETYFEPVTLTKEEVRIAEHVTGLPRKLAVNEVCLIMAEELVWPDESTLKKYLWRISVKLSGGMYGRS